MRDTTLQIDGLTIVARELGRGEAHSATAYYLPATQDLFVGDAVINRLHGPILEAAPDLGLAFWIALKQLSQTLEPCIPGDRRVLPFSLL